MHQRDVLFPCVSHDLCGAVFGLLITKKYCDSVYVLRLWTLSLSLSLSHFNSGTHRTQTHSISVD